MNAFAYIRVSGKSQVDGDGPERQRLAISEFVKGLKVSGWSELSPLKEFFEAGVSGTVEGVDRPIFSSLLETILTSKEPSVIIVERLDRLARDLMVQEILLAECRKNGISVWSVDQGQTIDMAASDGDPTRVLIRQIMGALAQWEKSAIVKKLKAARDRKRALTGRCDGTIPYGQKPGEASILKAMANILGGHVPVPCSPGSGAVEGTTFGGVAQLLNEAGFKTRKGIDWDRKTVRSIWLNHIKTKEKTQ